MDEKKRGVTGGYPIGNFGICAQINSSGEFLSSVLVNLSRQGGWLQRAAGGSLTIAIGETSLKTSDFSEIDSNILFPRARVSCRDERLAGINVSFCAIAPVVCDDAFHTSLPVIMSEVTLVNSSETPVEAILSFDLGETLEDLPISLESDGDGERIVFGFYESGRLTNRASIALASHSQKSICFFYVFYDSNGYYTDRLATIEDLLAYAVDNRPMLMEHTERFDRLLPSVGDEKLDRIMRWYVPAAIYLTRITSTFVITMGYCEFNQRDSYWTSWLHLAFWPNLERRMLEETAEHMRPDGKIPTTILPTIERDDDLDINCYFVLRSKRYWQFTRDAETIGRLWPAIVRAMAWLESRDVDGDGLLEQQSYWADWKDVNGVAGRKHAPHFEFAWLGALRACVEMAKAVGDESGADRFLRMAGCTDMQINQTVDAGGLWNGKFYTSTWYDGRRDCHVQQDQLVGAMWTLIPAERLKSVYQAMEQADAPWGIRETYPYRYPFSNEGGDYHNGGVWPFLCFMDATGRYVHGFASKAEDIIRKVGHWDLEEFGDYTPHEYLHGQTGENLGPTIQGWNADLYATIIWGALGLEVVDKNVIRLAPKINRNLRTAIKLPAGVIWYESADGEHRLSSECDAEITVHFKHGEREAASVLPPQGIVDLL